MREKWLTTKEAADLWRVTPWTIRKWVHKGVVTGVKFGPRTMRVLVVTEGGERVEPTPVPVSEEGVGV